jgi:hypothetical protein
MMQRYEYKILDYQRPYKDYGAKERVLDFHSLQGWELVTSSVIPMGISDDVRVNKTTGEEEVIGKKVWCIEHLYLRREIDEERLKKKLGIEEKGEE